MKIPQQTKQNDSEKGLICSGCGGRVLRVIYTRSALQGRIKRLRRCSTCGSRILTSERKIGEPP